jgi:hypothetical protein
VGGIGEARLAVTLARARGALGPRLSALADHIAPVDVAAIARPLVRAGTVHGMPPHVAAGVMPQLSDAAAAAAKRLGVLG